MENISVDSVDNLINDLLARGYNMNEARELLNSPVLIIPGRLTGVSDQQPEQKLTSEIVFFSKELNNYNVPTKLILCKNSPYNYIEERDAGITLGTLVISADTVQKIAFFANVAEIIGIMLNLIQLRYSAGRTEHLIREVDFSLEIHNGKKKANVHIKGEADSVTTILTPENIQSMLKVMNDEPNQ